MLRFLAFLESAAAVVTLSVFSFAEFSLVPSISGRFALDVLHVVKAMMSIITRNGMVS